MARNIESLSRITWNIFKTNTRRGLRGVVVEVIYLRYLPL
jgi:hypothetical protein